MKKTLLSVVGVAALSVAFISTVKAQWLLLFKDVFANGKPIADDSYIQILNDYDNTRWYSNKDEINWETVSNNARITVPAVENYDYDIATEYYLFISPYRVSQIKSWDPKVDVSKIKANKVVITSNVDKVEFNLWSTDLDSDQAYYGFIVPIDQYDWIGSPSNEICFKVSSNTYNQGEECDAFSLLLGSSNTKKDQPKNTENNDSHNAACVGMDLANISHTINGNTITLTWTAVEGDVVEIAIYDPEEDVYKSLWAVNMSDEKFDYKMQWDGEQNFMLTNGCRDVRYKADAKMENKKPEKEKIVPAATGPAQNILYIAIAAIAIYGVYVLFLRKSESK